MATADFRIDITQAVEWLREQMNPPLLPATYEAEHAALAFLSIPDAVERAFWGQTVYGKRYVSVIGSWTVGLGGETP